jgi:ABC-type sugar transport system substrate-binding protein
MAADWLAKHVNGKGNIVELQGTAGIRSRERAAQGIRRMRSRSIPV